MRSPFSFLGDLQKACRALARIDDRLEGIQGLISHAHHQQALETHSRYADPRHLARYGGKTFSHGDEDGIITEIFRRIGTTNHTFVEFGVGPASGNNTMALLLEGWKGVWIEKNERSLERIRQRLAIPLKRKQLVVLDAFITAESIQDLFAQGEVPAEFDLISIDIDGNDFWVWKAIERYSPRVVVIEYRSQLGPVVDAVMRYNPQHVWTHEHKNRNFGATLKAFERLGREKGYLLVGCNFGGTNAFFVREDLVTEELFLPPFTSEKHYEPKKGTLFLPVRTANRDDVSSFFEDQD
ncbi:MAG: hypothetical protein K0Q72_5448 [Armatimonadetes bacterium]|jgi:hypothetical protein|nr:hypothetical protein [Armatimonadota bacterium]